MKKVSLVFILLTLIITSISSVSSAQNETGEFIWAVRAGGTGNDLPLGITVDNSGNPIFVGVFSDIADFDGDLFHAEGYNTIYGPSDVFIAKYNPDGNLIWLRHAGGSLNNSDVNLARGVAVDAQDNIIATGSYAGSITFDTITLPVGGANEEAFLVKYDPDGNLLWAKPILCSYTCMGWAAGADAAGNVFVGGRFAHHNYGGNINFDGTILTTYGGGDIFLAKYDPNGNLLWARQAGSPSTGYGEFASDMAIDNLGNVLLTGAFGGTALFGTETIIGAGNRDIFLAKYDTNGNVLWARHAGGAQEDNVGNVVVNEAGDVFVSGSFSGTAIVDNLTVNSAGESDVFLARFDSDGNLLWVTTEGGSQADADMVISLDGFGHIIAASSFRGNAEFANTNLTSAGDADIAITQYDSDGNGMWAIRTGGIDKERSGRIASDYTGNLYLTGYFCEDSTACTESIFGYTSLISAGSADIYLARLQTAELNEPPQANAGGPYTVNEGAQIILDGSNSSDPNPDNTLTYEWDLNYDGVNFDTDATGVSSIFDAFSLDGPSDSRNVALRVTDDLGGSDIDTAFVTIDNVAPVIESLVAPDDPVAFDNQPISITVVFSDPGLNDTHDVTWNWGDQTTDVVSTIVSPASAFHSYAEAGVYAVEVVVTDDDNGSDTVVYEFVVIYDPDGGFVTGGGWILSEAGWCQFNDICAGVTGKANFGFVSKYKKGASIPSGNTEFNFVAGDFNFHSDTYDWLIINQGGANAQFKGTGSINGDLDPLGNQYKFMIWATDGDNKNLPEDDTFRIKIWYEDGDAEVMVYDNGFDQAIDGGNIKVHK